MAELGICLIILHVRQAFEDNSGSKCAGVLILNGCIYKGDTEFLLSLNMVQYAAKMSGYILMCLNAPQFS